MLIDAGEMNRHVHVRLSRTRDFDRKQMVLVRAVYKHTNKRSESLYSHSTYHESHSTPLPASCWSRTGESLAGDTFCDSAREQAGGAGRRKRR